MARHLLRHALNNYIHRRNAVSALSASTPSGSPIGLLLLFNRIIPGPSAGSSMGLLLALTQA